MLNKVTLIGNVGSDQEIKSLPSGKGVVNLSLATTKKWKDKGTGEKKEATEWHRVVFFSPLAEIVETWVKKGSQIYVEGELKTRKWQKDGVDMYTTEIMGHEMKMLGGNKDTGQAKPAASPQSQHSTAKANGYQPQESVSSYLTQPEPPPMGHYDDFDDSIPF